VINEEGGDKAAAKISGMWQRENKRKHSKNNGGENR